ncbi:MAG: phosphoribosylformylglycinamidine synthase I [Dehalococcoidia bacterium]|jgi:phosphoribosylformylglycinamidine synthase
MAKVRTLIVRAPGTNCDVETSFAFEQAGAVVASAHVNELVRRGKRISDYQIVVFPGGFTYGDDISAGKILANEIKLKLGDDIQKFVENGGLILGICNGFQVLVKAGILPQSVDASQQLTLSNNDSSRFECRWVYLNVDKQSPCVFTKGINSLYLPIAHGEGKVMAEPKALKGLKVVLRYADEKGKVSADYPNNPNGSADSIAGICDTSGRIFALMPHPERFLRWTQHPRWFREEARGWGDGFAIFKNAVEWVRSV